MPPMAVQRVARLVQLAGCGCTRQAAAVCKAAWQLTPAVARAGSRHCAAAASGRTFVAQCNSSGGSVGLSTSGAAGAHKKKVVFMGTPEVAAMVLQKLLAAASQPGASFEVAAVVTQPGRPKGRGAKRIPQPSPVEVAAGEGGLPPTHVLCPERASDPGFLEALRALCPDLCVTAAYGNYLPSKLLAIPRHGTLNIHPSLLPAFRGAAPVQRSLQEGVRVSGVSVLYTVKAMDAGPVLAQQQVEVHPDEQAPELLARLFGLGTELLLERLPEVWEGRGPEAAQPQQEAAASHAPKLGREEAVLDFTQPAAACHNKVRGFAGGPIFPSQPGTSAAFELRTPGGSERVELKVLRTRWLADPAAWPGGEAQQVAVMRDALYVRCGDGGVLELLEVQPPAKRAMPARDFVNGLRGKTLHWLPLEAPVAAAAAA